MGVSTGDVSSSSSTTAALSRLRMETGNVAGGICCWCPQESAAQPDWYQSRPCQWKAGRGADWSYTSAPSSPRLISRA